MRQKIELEGIPRGASHQAPRRFVLTRRRLTRIALFGLTLAALPLLTRPAPAEGSPNRILSQSGALPETSAHGASPETSLLRGVPPHAPGYLGTLFQNLSDQQAAALHVKTGYGVVVRMVDHDGPAGKAGLQPQDVILSLNGQPVEGAEALRRMIREDGVGADISLLVFRDGQKMVIHAQLAYRGEVEREAMLHMAEELPAESSADPGADGVASVTAAPEPLSRSRRFLMQMLHTTPFTGMMVANMEPQLGEFFGAPSGIGVLVESVAANSPAAAAGLRAGDVILKADSIGIRSAGAWVVRLHRSRGRAMVLVVLRDRRQMTRTLVPRLRKP